MRERAIFLDLDGVLIDSRVAIARSINHALVEHGISPRPDAELHALIGTPIETIMAGLINREPADLALVADLVAGYRSHYSSAGAGETEVFPGTVDLLEALAVQASLVVVTTKPREVAEPLLLSLGLRRHFSAVVGPGLDLQHETKTATLGRALRISEGRVHVAMVGDRRFDIEAAHAHGLQGIGVTWGSGTLAELRSAGADRIVTTHTELLDVLG
jgi:phosphoglycolate phosphatase